MEIAQRQKSVCPPGWAEDDEEKSMNYVAAISYLQSLITEPEGTVDNGALDLGWCCSEHALVLSLALNLCGKSAVVAEGEVNISLPNGRSQRVYRHWFVVADTSVYDSSIRYDEIRGIYPGCDLPVPVRFTQIGASQSEGNLHEVFYLKKIEHNPARYASATSSTPYGDWLTAQSVDHPRFWKRASEITAGILQSSHGSLVFSDRRAALKFTI